MLLNFGDCQGGISESECMAIRKRDSSEFLWKNERLCGNICKRKEKIIQDMREMYEQ